MNSYNFNIVNNILLMIIKSIFYFNDIYTILTINQDHINHAIENVKIKYKNIIDDVDTYIILIYIEYLFINIDLITDNYLLTDTYIYSFNMIPEQIKIDEKLLFDPNIIILLIKNNKYIQDNIIKSINDLIITNKINKFNEIIDIINYPDIKNKIKIFEENQKNLFNNEINNHLMKKFI